MNTNPTEPTIEEMRRAAARLTDKDTAEGLPTITRKALASIVEAAFTPAPFRGPAYPDEFGDLGEFISKTSVDSCEDMDLRTLSMLFGYVDMLSRTDGDGGTIEGLQYPRGEWIRDANRELHRAVATYFLRLHAHTLASIEKADAAEVGQ